MPPAITSAAPAAPVTWRRLLAVKDTTGGSCASPCPPQSASLATAELRGAVGAPRGLAAPQGRDAGLAVTHSPVTVPRPPAGLTGWGPRARGPGTQASVRTDTLRALRVRVLAREGWRPQASHTWWPAVPIQVSPSTQCHRRMGPRGVLLVTAPRSASHACDTRHEGD